MADFDINAHLRQAGFGMNQGGGNDQKPPEDLSDFINKLFDQFSKWISKGTGIKFDSFLNTGLGAHIDITKAALPDPPPAIADAKGGMLANVAFGEVFTKAGLTHGIGAPSGGEGGGGDGGSNQSFESYANSSGMGEMFIAAGGGNNFHYEDFNPRDLGNLPSPVIGDMGRGGRGAGMDIG